MHSRGETSDGKWRKMNIKPKILLKKSIKYVVRIIRHEFKHTQFRQLARNI